MNRLFLLLAGCAALFMVTTAASCNARQNATSGETNASGTPAETEISTPEPGKNMESNTPSAANTDPKNARVRIKTKFGDMVVRLYDETPQHRDNFLKLVDEKFYDGLLFHRCIANFMAQGGDPTSRNAGPNAQLGSGGPGYTVPAEFNKSLIHKKGALSAARQGDMVNPQRNSSGSQFYIVQGQKYTDAQLDQVTAYINQKTPGFAYTPEQREIYKTLGGTPQLDMDYTVFGEVIEGLNVIDAILSQPTSRPGDRPLEDIVMSMEVIR